MKKTATGGSTKTGTEGDVNSWYYIIIYVISLILQSNRFQSSIQEYLESGRQRVWSVFLLNSETETYVDICLTSKRTGPLVIRTHWFLLLKPNPTDYMAEPFYSWRTNFWGNTTQETNDANLWLFLFIPCKKRSAFNLFVPKLSLKSRGWKTNVLSGRPIFRLVSASVYDDCIFFCDVFTVTKTQAQPPWQPVLWMYM